MENEKNVETLRKYFQISCAAFNFAEYLRLVMAPSERLIPIFNKMFELHKLALNELEKEDPDMLIVDNLILEMQNTAEENNTKSKI